LSDKGYQDAVGSVIFRFLRNCVNTTLQIHVSCDPEGLKITMHKALIIWHDLNCTRIPECQIL
jgi:hypothetical protein